MTQNMHRKRRVRIFVEERNDGMVWVPYKTLIGYTIRNRPIIGRLWEQVYCAEEFASKAEAVAEAKRLAEIRIMEMFGHVDEAEIEWEVRHERGPELVAVTHEDASQATAPERLPPERHSEVKSMDEAVLVR
jgi:hypothetical protein